MNGAVSEITFAPMRSTKGGPPAPSAANLPGWKKIADAIKDAVNASGIPVQVLAERTGLTRQYIYSLMNGTCNPSMDKIEAVMDAAGTTLAQWIDDRALYGRDKRIHDQVQEILNAKGVNAITLRTTIEALLSFAAEKGQ